VNGWIQVWVTALGAAVAIDGYRRMLGPAGLDPDAVRLPWAVALGTGLVGARVAFGLERGLEPDEVLRLAPGGYILYGALPALPIAALGIRLRGMRPRPYLDHASPWIVLALAPARIGCWLAGCCDGHLVPTSLVAASANGLLGWGLLRRIRSGRQEGTGALALAAHGAIRTALDPLREQTVTDGGSALVLVAWGLLRVRAVSGREGHG
jgi:prolipoprotein diacylglyceryltransferase